ncbi:serine hydrolase [Nitratireductor sp. ZSWI3]|uniref:serine hydrolase domain-containing protein n=1 Tax=Nitratireductor sp. ZSWI3 TaxID=2966359 RepID=UPI00214FD042|nr:serine hydrolase [Nitratireductor sp. ZSWI3]MCR4266071.1 beta-lactamase family protein [Nitratireductor sp. ZSWI3]
MRKVFSLFKWTAGLLVVALIAGAVWLYAAPPALIRLGSSYAAKIICSNVFIAGRDPETVLRNDVQAPGHPLLKLMRVRVDAADATVHTGLFGVFGQGLAVFRGGTGCVAVPDGDLTAAMGARIDLPEPAPRGADQWPDGLAIDAARYPEVAELLADDALTGPGMRAVIVVQNGRIIGERYGADVAHFSQPLIGWSMTKTVTAVLVGTLVKAGRLSVDDDHLLTEWSDDERAGITIADLLGMQSGLQFNEDYGDVTDVTRMLYLQPDMPGFAADKPLVGPVGGVFSYSSGTSILLSRIWQNAFDEPRDALAWPHEALFQRIGMNSAVFETDPRGTYVGSSNLYASARDWARFGQLLLQDGVWKGERLLPEGWVHWMRTPTRASNGEYGRHVWLHGPRANTPRGVPEDEGFDLPPDAFWMLGHDGQTITVIPSLRMVVVRMGLTPSSLGYKPQALVEALAKLPGQLE